MCFPLSLALYSHVCKTGVIAIARPLKKKISNVDAFCLCVSLWPVLVYIPASVDIIRMLCARGTPALFCIYFFPSHIGPPVADCNGCFCLMKTSKQRSSVCFNKGNVHASAWTLHWCAGGKKKHVINKINSTSPLLVTQHQDQGMWKAEGPVAAQKF